MKQLKLTNRNKAIIILAVSITILISIIALILFDQNQSMLKLQTPKQKKETEELDISYSKKAINEDGSKITLLIQCYGSNGIEKIIKPDGMEILPAIDKTEIDFDFVADSATDYKCTLVGKDGTTKQETINVIHDGKIYTIEDMEEMAIQLNGTYTLMNSLDFKDRNSYRTQKKYDFYNEDKDGDGNLDNSWNPINSFSGEFNGQYNMIKNLYIYNSDNNIPTGLFATTIESNSVIENVKLQNVNIKGRRLYRCINSDML